MALSCNMWTTPFNRGIWIFVTPDLVVWVGYN